jgi:hypothetical protein
MGCCWSLNPSAWRQSEGPLMVASERLGWADRSVTCFGKTSGPNLTRCQTRPGFCWMPQCAAAGGLGLFVEGALGSLYVMEGSTLGGRLISRALSEVSWLPPGGVVYFNPCGSRTAAMWRNFQNELTAHSSPAADPLIEAGALDTFAVLHGWLSQRAASCD